MADADPIPDYPFYEERTGRRGIPVNRNESSEPQSSTVVKRTSSLLSTRSSETRLCRILEQDNESNGDSSICSQRNPSISHVSIGSSGKTTVGGTHITNISQQAKHLTGATESTLVHHQNRNAFAKTKFLEEALMKLVWEKKVIILSNFGEGRTSLGLELLLQLNKEDDKLYTQREPLIIRTASEWRVAIDPEVDTTVFLDDILGRLTLNKKRYTQWESIFPDIHAHVEDSSVYVIIAMNKYIFYQIRDRLRRYDLFSNLDKLIVDLSRCNRDDRELILTTQLSNPKSQDKRYEIISDERKTTDRESVIQIYESDIQEILSISNPVAFPLCCSSYINDEMCQIQGPEFFRNPTEIIYPEIETLCESNKYACLLLSLILFAKKDFTLNDIFYTDNYVALTEHLAKLCSIHNTSYEFLSGRLERQMKQLRNIFVEDCQGKLLFISIAVRVSMVKVFGTINMKYLIENLDVELLVKHTTTNETNDKKVYIDDYHFDSLAKRFAREIGSSSYVQIIKRTIIQITADSEIMQNESFRKRLVSHLTRMANYKTIIQCGEPENLLSTLFHQKDEICYKLAQEILKQAPDSVKKGCCCGQRLSWFTLEIHRSVLRAVQLKDYEACSILDKVGDGLPKRLLREIIDNGDGGVYAQFPQISRMSSSRSRQDNSSEITYVNPVFAGPHHSSNLFRLSKNLPRSNWINHISEKSHL